MSDAPRNRVATVVLTHSRTFVSQTRRLKLCDQRRIPLPPDLGRHLGLASHAR